MKFTVNFYTKSFGQTNIGHNLNLWGIFFYQNVILKISKLSGVHHNQKLSRVVTVASKPGNCRADLINREIIRSRNTEMKFAGTVMTSGLFSWLHNFFFRNKNYDRILRTWCVIWSKKIVLLQGWMTWGYAATMQCREPSKNLVS